MKYVKERFARVFGKNKNLNTQGPFKTTRPVHPFPVPVVFPCHGLPEKKTKMLILLTSPITFYQPYL
jgi:hypothetical protein